MAEVNSGAQHITELDFDLSQIVKQFEDLNHMVINEGTKLSDLVKANWNIADAIKMQNAEMEQETEKSSKKMVTSWRNAYKLLGSMGDPMESVRTYFKSQGKRTAIVWTEEMESEFRTRLPDLKKQMSEWVQWVGEGQGVHFDDITNQLKEINPNYSGISNYLELIERLNDDLQTYKATARQVVETGSVFSEEIPEAERLRAAYESLTGQTKEFYRVRKDGFTPQESSIASQYNDMYQYLQKCAAEVTALADTEAKIKVQLNENGQIRKASITYTDQQNRTVQQMYGWFERLNVLTGETEKAFGAMGSSIIDDKLARANASAAELAKNTKDFEKAYEQTAKSIASSYTYMQKAGFSKEQLDVVEKIAQRAYQLESSNGDITADVLKQMQALQEQAKTTERIVKLDKERKAIAAAEKAERERVLSLNSQIASIQKQIRTSRVGNADLVKESYALRTQTDELVKQLQISGKLTDEQRKQLDNIQQQVSAMKNKTVTAIADNSSSTTNQRGLLESAGRWFGAYQVWHLSTQAARETIATMKDVESSVTEVSRVINDASFNFNQFTGDVFKLSQDYGRSFEDTVDIATRFAQAGYSVSETLSMTKDSLLALNTAQLDSQQSTQSLIGILQQWGFQSEDMIGVIDRINKVADNYAITSQDLVTALLESSSMAKQANLSFEQTVGVLTAMKTASGATGKKVGNAFKSILAYIQRPGSLKGFEDLGIDVYADKATGKLNKMMFIFEQMVAKWNTGSTQMQDEFMKAADAAGFMNEDLAVALDATEEYTNAQNAFADASDKANTEEERRQMNLAAGVYRRNYYTALMENFSQVYDVVLDQQDADGYSMQENEKYMGTLEAKYETFISALKKLAVEAGNSGMLNLAKGALELGTAIANVSGNMMTLPALIGGVTLALGLAKKEFSLFGITATGSLDAVKLKAIGTQVAISGGLTLAIEAIIVLYDRWRDAQEKMRKETDAIIESTEQLTSSLQSQVDSINSNVAAQMAEVDIHNQMIDSLDRLSKKENLSNTERSYMLDIIEKLNKAYPDLHLAIDEETNKLNMDTEAMEKNTAARREQIQARAEEEIILAKAKLKAEAEMNNEQANSRLSDLEDEKSRINAADPNGLIVDRAGNYVTVVAALRDVNSEIKDINQAIAENDEIIKENGTVIESYWNKQEQDAENAKQSTDNFTQTVKTLSEDALKELATNMSALDTAAEKMTAGTALTTDEMLKLLAVNPDLATAIQFTADGYYIQADALESARQAAYDKKIADLELQAQEKVNSISAGGHSEALVELYNEYVNATNASEKYAAALAMLNYLQENSEATSKDLASVVAQIAALYNDLNTLPERSAAKNIKSQAKSAETAANKALSQAKKQAQSYIKDLRKASKVEQDSIQKAIDAKKKDRKADDDYYNRRIKKIKAQYDEDIKGLRRVKEERSRNRERADIEEELEYWNQRTGTEAVEKIKDLKEQLSRKEEDWKLDDKITSLEDERDEEVAYLEKKRDRVKANYDEEIELLEQKKTKVKEGYDEQIGYIQDVYNNSDASANQILQAVENVKNGHLVAIQTAADAVNNAITSVAQTAQSAFSGVSTPGGGSVDSHGKENPGTGSRSNGLDALFANQFSMIENLKQAQLQAIEEVIEESINKFDDVNKTMLNSAAFKAPEIANQYKEKLVMAVHDNAILQFNSANNALVISAGGYASKLLDQYDSKFLTPLRDRLESILEDIRDARSERAEERKRSSKSSSKLRRSHTGSLITKSGIVDVQMGEIVVRRDISEGLLQVIADNNSRMQAARNYYSTSNANSVDNSRKSETVVKVQGPLVQIEKQEFTPEYKPEMAGNTLARTLKRRIGVKR